MKAHLLFSILFTFSFTLLAQDGTLDTSFGNNGSVILPYYGEDAQVLSIIKIDDDLFAAGYTKENTQDFTIVKMDLDGNLDSTFGENGTLRLELNSGFGRCSKLLQHPDGGIMGLGWDRSGNKDQYVLVKMDTNGNLDSNFGEDGVVTDNWDSSSFAESEIADASFLSDGRLIAAGRSYNGGNTDFVVACYDIDGNPCADFGDEGLIVQQFGDSDQWEIAEEVAVDFQDNIYVSGEDGENANMIVKYDSNGNIVSNFGNNGMLEFTHSSGETLTIGDMELDYSNRLLVSGTVSLNSNFAFVSRYNSNGNRDTNFGNQGELVISTINSLRITDGKIIDDNSLLLLGKTSGFGTKQVLAKIDNTGSLVQNFGQNGTTSTQLATSFTGAAEMALDAESIYVGGDALESDNFEFAVTKYSNLLVSNQYVIANQLAVELFPNPISYALNISAEEGFSHVEIYDINGQMIFKKKWPSTVYKLQVNTEKWSSGMYTVLTKNEAKVSTTKFIK